MDILKFKESNKNDDNFVKDLELDQDKESDHLESKVNEKKLQRSKLNTSLGKSRNKESNQLEIDDQESKLATVVDKPQSSTLTDSNDTKKCSSHEEHGLTYIDKEYSKGEDCSTENVNSKV